MKNKIEKKPLNIAQRVEILLCEGVDNPKKWATVHGYEEPSDEEKEIWQSNEDCLTLFKEWSSLREHHLTETKFLFDIIRELCEQVKALDSQIDAQLENDRGVDG